MGNQFSLAESELGDLIPVELDEDKKEGISESVETPMRLTTEGEKSLLTMLGDDEAQNRSIWKNLPGFYWQSAVTKPKACLLYTSPSPRDQRGSRMPSSA